MQTVPNPVPADPQARILAWLEQARAALLSGQDCTGPLADAFFDAATLRPWERLRAV